MQALYLILWLSFQLHVEMLRWCINRIMRDLSDFSQFVFIAHFLSPFIRCSAYFFTFQLEIGCFSIRFFFRPRLVYVQFVLALVVVNSHDLPSLKLLINFLLSAFEHIRYSVGSWSFTQSNSQEKTPPHPESTCVTNIHTHQNDQSIGGEWNCHL